MCACGKLGTWKVVSKRAQVIIYKNYTGTHLYSLLAVARTAVSWSSWAIKNSQSRNLAQTADFQDKETANALITI